MCTVICIIRPFLCKNDFPQYLHLKLVPIFSLLLVYVEVLQTALASGIILGVLSRETCPWGRRGLTGHCATVLSPGTGREVQPGSEGEVLGFSACVGMQKFSIGGVSSSLPGA